MFTVKNSLQMLATSSVNTIQNCVIHRHWFNVNFFWILLMNYKWFSKMYRCDLSRILSWVNTLNNVLILGTRLNPITYSTFRDVRPANIPCVIWLILFLLAALGNINRSLVREIYIMLSIRQDDKENQNKTGRRSEQLGKTRGERNSKAQ